MIFHLFGFRVPKEIKSFIFVLEKAFILTVKSKSQILAILPGKNQFWRCNLSQFSCFLKVVDILNIFWQLGVVVSMVKFFVEAGFNISEKDIFSWRACSRLTWINHNVVFLVFCSNFSSNFFDFNYFIIRMYIYSFHSGHLSEIFESLQLLFQILNFIDNLINYGRLIFSVPGFFWQLDFAFLKQLF